MLTNCLIIGSGKISSKLSLLLAKRFNEINIIPLRKLKNKAIDDINSYQVVLYVAYDQFSFCNNIKLLKKLINLLETRKYSGSFIFFNTQGIILNKIIKNYTNNILDFIDRYSLTKRIQSRILKASNLNITQLHIPMAYNISGFFDEVLYQFKDVNKIKLPNNGENNFYILNIDDLGRYLLEIYDQKISGNLFIYSEYTNLKSLLKNVNNNIKIANDKSEIIKGNMIISLFRSLASSIYYCIFTTNYKKREIQHNTKIFVSDELSSNVKSLFMKNYSKPESIKFKTKKL